MNYNLYDSIISKDFNELIKILSDYDKVYIYVDDIDSKEERYVLNLIEMSKNFLDIDLYFNGTLIDFWTFKRKYKPFKKFKWNFRNSCDSKIISTRDLLNEFYLGISETIPISIYAEIYDTYYNPNNKPMTEEET